MHDDEPRRTQVERTAQTVGRLLDATIAAIVEVGYAGSSTREIGERAGVSQGGLFRHFRSRKELLVAALGRVHERQLAALQEAANDDDEFAVLAAIRDISRSPEAVVGLELCVAARTDTELLEGLKPMLARHREAIRRCVERHPLFSRLTPESLQTWLDIAQQSFQGEALWLEVDRPRDLSNEKLDALIELLDHLIAVDQHHRDETL